MDAESTYKAGDFEPSNQRAEEKGNDTDRSRLFWEYRAETHFMGGEYTGGQ